MKLRALRCLLGAVLAVFSALALAQGVYVTQGANGPVFSDKPQQGAKEVTLKPLNVVPAAPEASAPALPEGKTEVKRDAVQAPAYQRFAVVSPQDNGSAVANTALLEVRVAVEPALQLGEGHAFVVSLNGRPVGLRFTATEFMIPPEFWDDEALAYNQRVQLDASLVDANGQTLIKAAPVSFTMRYVTVNNRPNRPLPGAPGKPNLPRPPKASKVPEAQTPEATPEAVKR